MIEKVEGIVLSTVDYKETSKILNVLTKEHGLIGIMSKGCKSIKSPLRFCSNNFTYASFNIYYKKDKLSTLVSCDILDYFKNIKKDILLMSYLNYLCSLTKEVVKQDASKNIYEILISGLKKINEGLNPLIITNIIELKFLDYLGVPVNLDECVICGSSKIVNLSILKGGYVCSKCNNEPLVDTKTIKMLRMYYYVDINKITEIKVSENTTNEINMFLTSYYEHNTGLYLKSKKFIENVMNI